MTLIKPGPTVVDPRFDEAWTQHRGHLLNVAYRLLGSLAEAEDVVQEAYSRLLEAGIDGIDDPRAWLSTVTSRLCLDSLRSARVRREAYLGPWFPEPLLEVVDADADPAERVTQDESIRIALLMLLERLSPAERVTFVLHDVFQFSFDEVARIVDRTPAACRQLVSRARRHVAEGNTRFEIDREEQLRVAERFATAVSGGRLRDLLSVLDPAVAGWVDVGGFADIETRVGAGAVAERLLRIFAGARLTPTLVNGEAGVIVSRDGAVNAVVVLENAAGLIKRIDAIADPNKLRHVSVPS